MLGRAFSHSLIGSRYTIPSLYPRLLSPCALLSSNYVRCGPYPARCAVTGRLNALLVQQTAVTLVRNHVIPSDATPQHVRHWLLFRPYHHQIGRRNKQLSRGENKENKKLKGRHPPHCVPLRASRLRPRQEKFKVNLAKNSGAGVTWLT